MTRQSETQAQTPPPAPITKDWADQVLRNTTSPFVREILQIAIRNQGQPPDSAEAPLAAS